MLSLRSADTLAELRSTVGETAPTFAADFFQQAVNPAPASEVLGGKVCRVLRAQYLAKLHTTVADRLLYPEGLGADMPQITQPLSGTHANSGRTVGPHSDGQL